MQGYNFMKLAEEHKNKILVVEDEKNMREIIKSFSKGRLHISAAKDAASDYFIERYI